MIDNNPLTQLWEGLGRQIPSDEIIDEFRKAPDLDRFVATMAAYGAGKSGQVAKLRRRANEFAVWWSMQVRT